MTEEPHELTAAEFCGALPAICAKLVRCGVAETQQGCEHTIELNARCPRWEEELDAGHVRFDARAASECLASYDQCPPSSGRACLDAFPGKKSFGVACNEQHECAPRLFCEGLTCPGHCAAGKTGGEIVEHYAEECMDPSMGIILCSDFKTRCPLALGEDFPCLRQPEWAVCGNGLFCEQSSGRCRREKTLGEPCATANAATELVECAWGTQCRPTDAGTYACQALQTVGEICGSSCRIDLSCFGTCQTIGALGDHCDSTIDCRSDAYCEQHGSSTCQPRRSFGEPCHDPDASCAEDLFCTSTTGDDGGVVKRCLFGTPDGGHLPCSNTEQ